MSLVLQKPPFIPREPAQERPPITRWQAFQAWSRREVDAWKESLTNWETEKAWTAEFINDRLDELRLFARGTRGLFDLVNIAFFTRFTMREIDEMRELAIQVGRTPPHAFAIFVGIVTTVITLLYAVMFGLPWPLTTAFIVRTTFLAWQAYRLCVFLGSVFTPPARMPTSYPAPPKRLPEIPAEEDERWR